jgi:hypothetical protein
MVKIMSKSKILACLGSALFAACSRAAPPASCPNTIAVHQEWQTPIEGWKATLDDTPNRLASVTFFDGPPEEKASLVNDRTMKAAGKEVAAWHFLPRPNREIWIACGYSGTSIVLTKRLAPKTAVCEVTYNPRQRIAGLPVIVSIACKEK